MKISRLRFGLLRQTYPWMHVAILLVMATASRDARQQIRLWRIVYKIDFAAVLAIAIELSQPEFWI